MSYNTKKLQLSKKKYKNRGYQNFWHISKLTKKQLNWSKFKTKMHSTEQGRPVAKYRLFKLVSPRFAIQNTAKFKTAKTEQHKFRSREEFFWNRKVNYGLHSKKRLSLYMKPFWFFDKAAPIPGVSFLKKAKVQYNTKQRAYKKFQSWLEILNKKQMIVVFNFQKKQNLSKNWNAIMQMDSLFQSVLRKTAFAYNARERKNIFHSKAVAINGQNVQKNIGAYKIGDIFMTNNNTQPSRQVLSVGLRSLYTTHKSLQKKTLRGSKVGFFAKQKNRAQAHMQRIKTYGTKRS